ncbi:rCG36978, partial [Rattus norvegicus]
MMVRESTYALKCKPYPINYLIFLKDKETECISRRVLYYTFIDHLVTV